MGCGGSKEDKEEKAGDKSGKGQQGGQQQQQQKQQGGQAGQQKQAGGGGDGVESVAVEFVAAEPSKIEYSEGAIDVSEVQLQQPTGNISGNVQLQAVANDVPPAPAGGGVVEVAAAEETVLQRSASISVRKFVDVFNGNPLVSSDYTMTPLFDKAVIQVICPLNERGYPTITAQYGLRQIRPEKEEYVANLKAYLKRVGGILPAERQKSFTQSMQPYIQAVVGGFADYFFFVGAMGDTTAMVIPCKPDGRGNAALFFITAGMKLAA